MKRVDDPLSAWDNVAFSIRHIFSNKAEAYGWSRFDHHSDVFDFWMCFSDVHRKTLRLEELTRGALSVPRDELTDMARAKLIDDYKDIANYAIMAVMKLEERDDDEV